ncbi:hypothetical protein F2P79_009304 [Pimephales promelas]|nr:hypothetical protein F2P79_009304 [Pimephales promelas]
MASVCFFDCRELLGKVLDGVTEEATLQDEANINPPQEATDSVRRSCGVSHHPRVTDSSAAAQEGNGSVKAHFTSEGLIMASRGG